MRASDIKPGQRFTLPTDPHDAEHTLTKIAGDGCRAINPRFEIVEVHPDSSCELVEGGEGSVLHFTVTHHDEENGKQLAGRVMVGPNGLDIFFDGFGQKTMNPGYGAPVYIEPDDNGNPLVYCWSEIDSEDYTHKVSLHGARDTREVE